MASLSNPRAHGINLVVPVEMADNDTAIALQNDCREQKLTPRDVGFWSGRGMPGDGAYATDRDLVD